VVTEGIREQLLPKSELSNMVPLDMTPGNWPLTVPNVSVLARNGSVEAPHAWETPIRGLGVFNDS